MKMYNLLPSGAGSVIAAAAKLQRNQEAQALVNKVKLEIAQRAEAYESSVLASIDEYSTKDSRKCISLCELYLKRYPKSGVRAVVESVIVTQRDFLAEKKARVIASKVQLSHQGIPQISRIPAEWSRA